ncbi:MAG: hypothetical protein KatS3mg083_301 [Candidatus Dojkabacteria bacterium]|nr:MAG: hypothetical protein KatS3mg084_0308 [Candidatus Dojkabacteria bacterium]GIW57356.1 MAG: hypothetical protein KatS3mg083_301 [Candidatus Dojkabacteria bacterium]
MYTRFLSYSNAFKNGYFTLEYQYSLFESLLYNDAQNLQYS